MFTVEASQILPHAPARVFAVARACHLVPQWCGVVRVADDACAWRVEIRDLTLLVRPRTVSIDAEHGIAVHEALGSGLGVRWELTIRPHRDGASFHARTTLRLGDVHEQRATIYRAVARLAPQDLARLAALVARNDGP